jgi:uncharacterized protein
MVSRIVSSQPTSYGEDLPRFPGMRPRTGVHVLVMAKAPHPGTVKTRLCPPFSPAEASAIAEAALSDTLEAVARSDADRRIIALDGPAGPWLPSGFQVIGQGDGSFDARLAHAWTVAGGPGLQIGMDTPQVTPAVLNGALETLDRPGVDSVLGGAVDGGWWAIGLRQPTPQVFLDVPMSVGATCACQYGRLRMLGLSVDWLPVLRDVDTVDDARDHADKHPHTRTAVLVRSLLGAVASA